MKKLLALFLTALLFTACGAPAQEPPVEPSSVPAERPEKREVPAQSALEEPEPQTVWEVPGTAVVSLLQETYPVGPERMTVIVENTGGEKLGFGMDAHFEKFEDGQWHSVEFVDNACFTDEMWMVSSGSARSLPLCLGLLKQPLSEGLYRVTGTTLYIGDNGEKTEPWQLRFRAAPGGAPEPDSALYILGQPVSGVADKLSVLLLNSTGEAGPMQDIPYLERRNEAGEWIEVPYKDNVGFCGTPDGLPAGDSERWEPVLTLWGILEEGRYRLSYPVEEKGRMDGRMYGEFDVIAPELMICGYPTA